MNVLINNQELYKVPRYVRITNGAHYSACGMLLNYVIKWDDDLFVKQEKTERILPFIFYPICGDHKRLKGLVEGKRQMEVYFLKKDILKCYPKTTQEQMYNCISFANKFLFADPFDEKELKQKAKIYPSDLKMHSEKTHITKEYSELKKQVYNILQWNDKEGACELAINIAEYIKNKAGDNKIMSERIFSTKTTTGTIDAGIIYPNKEAIIYYISASSKLDYEKATEQLKLYATVVKKYKIIGASIIHYDKNNKVFEIPINL